MMRPKIFVQIASYRDPELLPTLRDCIEKATYPERLTFGLCWQHDEEETLDEFINDDRFRIINHHWSNSCGLGWARSQIRELYSGEEYTLQLDSHHRFADGWDESLIEMLLLTGSDKPILTSYAAPYDPITNNSEDARPLKMVGSNFTDSGTILFKPGYIENWEDLEKPIPARFVSGHFYFTIGDHCKEYQVDPDIYFAGEEISLSIRSFTMGYDLFHPHRNVIWHEYTREGRVKHWDDFKDSKDDKPAWHVLDQYSKKRLRHLLREELSDDIDLGQYGLGKARSHSDYETYAGINFKERKLHPDTLKGIDPPVNDLTDWSQKKLRHQHVLVQIPDPPQNLKLIYLAVTDESGADLYRQNLNHHQKYVMIEFMSDSDPKDSAVWFLTADDTWIGPHMKRLSENPIFV